MTTCKNSWRKRILRDQRGNRNVCDVIKATERKGRVSRRSVVSRVECHFEVK